MVARVLFVLAVLSVAPCFADVHVGGHLRYNGSWVQPHFRSQADGNFYNNWSTYGNVNPYTGTVGTRHYPTYQHYYYQPYQSHYRGYGRW